MSRWVNVVRRDKPTSGDDSPTSIVRLDDVPTSYVQVVTSPPPAPAPSWIRRIAPWAVFGVVAVVVVGGTTAWSASVRGPEKPLLASVPSTYAPVPQATSVVPPPAEPTAEPEPEEERAPTRTRRATTPDSPPQLPVVAPPPPSTPPAPATSAPAATSSVTRTPQPTSSATTTRRQFLLPSSCPDGTRLASDGTCRRTAGSGSERSAGARADTDPAR